MGPLTLHLLGPPRVEVDGSPLEVDTRKAVAVLAYLAVTGRPQTRERLSALLWPDSDPAGARAALRRTLSVLRRATGDGVVVVDGTTIGLETDATWCDVTASRALVDETRRHGHPQIDTCPDCIGPLTSAVRLHDGPLLDGFVLRDGEEFGEWRFLEAESLQRELGVCLDRLIVAHTHAGAFDAAITVARDRLGLDPLHEQAHRQLMMLLTWTGHRTAAIGQYRACVAALHRDLGVLPLDRTTALHQAIVSGRAPAPPTAKAPAPRDVSTPTSPAGHAATPRLPLVGRHDELRRLREAHAAVGSSGHLVVVAGEAGIGRTRLADELADEVATKGGRVLTARCHADEGGLAYGTAAELLRTAMTTPDQRRPALTGHRRNEVARLLPEVATPGAPPPAPLTSPGAAARFHDAVARTIVAACTGPVPGLVVVDDAHLADDASLAVLRYLAHRLAEHPICLMLTWSTQEPMHARRLRTLLGDLGAAVGGVVVPERLTADDVARLADAASLRLAPDQVARLAAATEGLPLVVAAYLEELHGASPDGPASLSEMRLPATVRDAFLPRIEALDEPSRQVLTTAAIVGRSFHLTTLTRASGRSDEEVLEAVDALVLRGLVRETSPEARDPSYDFSHDTLRTIVLDEATSARRRLLHARVADALAAPDRTADADELAATRAHHLALAGRHVEAADAHRTAGGRAARLHANAEAVHHLEAAVALGHDDVAGLQATIGDLRALLGDYPGALAAYESAAAADPSRAATIDHRIAGIHLRTGDHTSAGTHLESARELADAADHAFHARILADISLVRLRDARLEDAQELAERALALVEPDGDAVTRAQIHNLLGILARRTDRHESARTHLRLSVELADQAGDLGARVAARNNLALASRMVGELDAATAQLREALTLCTVQGDRHREAALRNNLADVLHDDDQHDGAMVELKHAVTIFTEIGEPDRLQPDIWKLQEW